ncbi:MAG: SPOR domain-containing protein [Hymenobacter sp.]|nr:MAG: SPOR domain-containing protein [Hymenobacter sp.]
MTTAELARRLEADGCNPANYTINARSYDGFCLMRNGRQWVVFYSERGDDQPPIFTSEEEAAACQYYLDFVLRMRHSHCVGFLRSATAAQALQTKLAQHGIETQASRLLYSTNDYRHQVFVIGKDIFAARKLLGKLPVTDAEDKQPGLGALLWKWLAGGS